MYDATGAEFLGAEMSCPSEASSQDAEMSCPSEASSQDVRPVVSTADAMLLLPTGTGLNQLDHVKVTGVVETTAQ